ncbi:response regulator [Olivibacter sp. XZL3]|uniref:response regulator n=1 Tax=Olivibacter sp. XZL3 TaxID=1735116 RepID=UPI001065E625|nr:response regulator [Olivibacter sp. XZL3]
MKIDKTEDLKILFAEDNEVNRFYLRSLIEQHFEGVSILEAQNGKEAVDMYELYRPNLVLLDLNMPVMKGDEAAAKIRALADMKDDKVKIIALTGASPEFQSLSYSNGIMDDYIVKPFKAEVLLDLIAPMLRGRESIESPAIETRAVVSPNKYHFDYEELRSSLANDEPLIKEVLGYVADHLDTFMPRFNTLVLEQNQHEIQKLAHELRGTALNARLSLLAEYILPIENGSNFDKDFLHEQLQQVSEEINYVKPLLARMLD